MASKGDIEIEILDENNKPIIDVNADIIAQAPTQSLIEAKQKEKVDLVEELAINILDRFQQLDTLKFRFLDTSLPAKERLEAIIQFKSSMIIPALRMSLGLDYNPDILKGSYDVLGVINTVESSILGLLKYEESETINFSNPKIMASYKMLFEIILEVISEEVSDSVIIRNIVEKTSVRCVNIENEFNRIFKKVSNKLADLAENDLTEKFINKNKDPEIAKQRLIKELERAKGLISYTEIDNLLEVLEGDNTTDIS